MNIEWIPSPNYSSRSGERITAIVIHYTASMNIEGTISWFQNRSSMVSAHYVVGRDGRLVQMVQERYAAWHAGNSMLDGAKGVNRFSVGIELVGTGTSGFAPEQLAILYELTRTVVEQYQVPVARIVGHRDIAPGRKDDPDGPYNQFDWAALRGAMTAAPPRSEVRWPCAGV